MLSLTPFADSPWLVQDSDEAESTESVDTAQEAALNTIDRVKEWISDPKFFLSDLSDFASVWGPRLLGALAVYVVGRWVARMVRSAVRNALLRADAEEMLANFVASLAHVAVLVFVVIFVLGTLGIPTTGFAAVVAAAGFAVGFALQGSLGNFASGVMIMIFRPFSPGDYIEGGGNAGSVVDVGIFATVLKTPDNKKIIVPNGELTSSSLTNYSANPTRRIDLVFGIGYEADIDHARSILAQILKADDRVLTDPEPQIAVSELADSSVNFVVRPWVKSSDYWDVRCAVTERVKKEFDKAGISIPFPQRDVHMYTTEAGS